MHYKIKERNSKTRKEIQIVKDSMMLNQPRNYVNYPERKREINYLPIDCERRYLHFGISYSLVELKLTCREMNEQKAKKHPETKNHCKRHVFRHWTSDESESSDPSSFVTSFVPVWDFAKHVTLHGFWISALFAKKKNSKTQHSRRKGKYRTPWFNSLKDQDSSQFWNGGRRQRTNEWCVKNWGSFWNMMNF